MIKDFPEGLWYCEDAKKIFALPKDKILSSMEELIQNFMIVTEGPRFPPAKCTSKQRTRRVRLVYVISKGAEFHTV